MFMIYFVYFWASDDGKLQAESDSGEFWVIFGGFAPIGKKIASEDDIVPEKTPAKLYMYSLLWFSLCFKCGVGHFLVCRQPVPLVI